MYPCVRIVFVFVSVFDMKMSLSEWVTGSLIELSWRVKKIYTGMETVTYTHIYTYGCGNLMLFWKWKIWYGEFLVYVSTDFFFLCSKLCRFSFHVVIFSFSVIFVFSSHWITFCFVSFLPDCLLLLTLSFLLGAHRRLAPSDPLKVKLVSFISIDKLTLPLNC